MISAIVGNLALNPLSVLKSRYIFHRGTVSYNQIYDNLNGEGYYLNHIKDIYRIIN